MSPTPCSRCGGWTDSHERDCPRIYTLFMAKRAREALPKPEPTSDEVTLTRTELLALMDRVFDEAQMPLTDRLAEVFVERKEKERTTRKRCWKLIDDWLAERRKR